MDACMLDAHRKTRQGERGDRCRQRGTRQRVDREEETERKRRQRGRGSEKEETERKRPGETA